MDHELTYKVREGKDHACLKNMALHLFNNILGQKQSCNQPINYLPSMNLMSSPPMLL